MKKNKINKKIQKQLIKLYEKVGLIVNLSQMIEYTLANILAFNEILKEFEKVEYMFVFEFNDFAKKANEMYKFLNNHPFGYGVNKAKEMKYFTDEFNQILDYVLKERNYVIHELFKEDLYAKYLETNPTVYYERLEKLILCMNNVNNELNEIFRKQKEEYKLIW